MKPGLRRIDLALLGLGFILILTTFVFALVYAPSVDTEAMNAPNAQKIFYWHVPSAWASFLAFSCLFVGSLAWFWMRKEWGWALHCAGAEVGLLFGLMVLASGPIWGQAEWQRPWDWSDVRLNTFLALTGLSAFLVLGRRSQPSGEETRDTFASLGLFGFLLVPLTSVATTLWNRSHPPAVVLGEDGGLDPQMAQIFWFGVMSFTVLSVAMLRIHMHIVQQEMALEEAMLATDTSTSSANSAPSNPSHKSVKPEETVDDEKSEVDE